MKKDKALKKIISAREPSDVPFGLETRIMDSVRKKAKKRQKRSYILGLCLVSSVSVALIAFAVYLLGDKLKQFVSGLTLPDIEISPDTVSIFQFYAVIAGIVLFLLILDGFFRSLFRKKRTNSKISQ